VHFFIFDIFVRFITFKNITIFKIFFYLYNSNLF